MSGVNAELLAACIAAKKEILGFYEHIIPACELRGVVEKGRFDVNDNGALKQVSAAIANADTPPPQPATEGPVCDCGKIEHGRHHSHCPVMRKPATEGVDWADEKAREIVGCGIPAVMGTLIAQALRDAARRSPTAQRGPEAGEGVYKREAMAWRRYMQHAREHELIVFRVRSQHATDEQRQPFDTLTELELKLMEAQDAVDALAAEKGDKT